MIRLRSLCRLSVCSGILSFWTIAPPLAVAQDLFEIVDVPLVEVNVLVTDAQGRPVVDLDQEDFSLLVDGEAQTFPFFVSPVGDGSGAVIESRSIPAHLVIVFDNTSVERQTRNKVLDDFRDFLGRDQNPYQQIMVATLGQSGLQIEQEFTNDPALTEAALERVAETVARDVRAGEYEALLRDIQKLAGARDPTQRDTVSQTAILTSQILAFSDRFRQDTERTLGHLWNLTEALEGLPGRRSILYLGGAISASPGESLLTALKGVLDRINDGWAQRESANLPASVGSGGARAIDAVASAASLRGVAIYSVVVGGGAQVLSTGSSAASISSKDSSTMDSSGSWSPGFDSRVRSESRSGLDKLAAATGGSVQVMIGRAGPVLEQLQEQVESSYVLGFHPLAGADGKSHEIDVRVGKANLRVRHRQSFRARGWDEETGTRLQSALLFGGGRNVHGVALEAKPATAGEANRARVPITIQFPLTSLSLEPLGTRHRGQASVFVTGSGRGRLETAAIRKSVLPVALSNEELSEAVGQMAEYRLELDLPAGARQLAVAVRDDLSTELSIVRMEVPTTQSVRFEPQAAPILDELSSDQLAPIRLPSAALLMSGQEGGNLQLEAGNPRRDEADDGIRIPVRGWVDVEPLQPTSLDVEVHAYVLDAVGLPLSRSSRRTRLQLTEEGSTLALPIERPEQGSDLRVLVRDLKTHDFGLVRIPLTDVGFEEPGATAALTNLDLELAARTTEIPGASRSPKASADNAVRRSRGRISLEKISGGLVEVVELAANGDTSAAQSRLRDLEIELTSNRSPMAVIELGKKEARVLAAMADDSWERLLPLALIWGELIGDYRRSLMGPLSEHAMAMSTELATTMARKAETPEAKAEAADLLLCLSGYLLYEQRLSRTEQLLELAARADPGNGRAVVAFAATREQRGDFEGAITVLRRLPADSIAADEGRLRLAVNLIRAGQGDEAERLLQGLVDGDEEWVAKVAVQELVRLLVSTGRSPEAIPFLRAAVRRWPQEQAMRLQMAWVLDRSDRHAEAGDLALQIAKNSTATVKSPRFRYHRWYAEGLIEVRRELAGRSSARAVEFYEDLAREPSAGGGR